MKELLNSFSGLLLIVLLNLSCQTQAQEWQAEGSVIMNSSNTKNNTDLANPTDKFSVGIGYGFYFTDQLSIALNLGYQKNEMQKTTYDQSGAYKTEDLEGEEFEFRYTVDYIKEEVSWHSLRVPLTLQYETAGESRWYIRSGVIYDMAIGKAQSSLKSKGLHTSGYYEQYDAELTAPKFAGFGDFETENRKEKIKLKDNFIWTVETGVKQKINEKQSLYFGVFIELGLTEIKPKSSATNKTTVSYPDQAGESPKIHTDLNGRHKEKLKKYNIGFRIRYGFGK